MKVSNRTSFLRVLVFVLYIALALAIYFSYFDFKQRDKVFESISRAISVSVYSLKSFWMAVTSNYQFQQSAVERIKELERQILAQQLEIIAYKRFQPELDLLRKEKEELEKLFDYEKKINYKFIRAKVYLKDPQNLFKTFILDRGKNGGVEKDQIVIAYSKEINNYALIGKIMSVTDNNSTVMTLMDNQFRVGVDVEGGNNSILEGFSTVKIILRVRFLDRSLESPVGREVSTSNIGDMYPKGIAIGKISTVENQEDIFQTVLVKPYVDFFDVKYVYIIQKEQ